MIDNIIRLSVERRFLFLVLALILIGIGVWSYQRLPIDAVPDITNVQVQINTKAPGYSPLEAEQRITFPVETALYGLPNLSYTRSILLTLKVFYLMALSQKWGQSQQGLAKFSYIHWKGKMEQRYGSGSSRSKHYWRL